METNDKERQLSPAERRRRMEARRERRERERKKKRLRILMIAGAAALLVLIVVLVFFWMKKSSGKGEHIEPKGDSYVIFLDPGHGGADVGLSGGDGLEKDITMDICSKLKIMLESQNYTVIMSREDDTRLSKEERVAAANASGADLLVSVHCSYSGDSRVSGAVSHYKEESKASEFLCQNIQEALVKESGALDGGTDEGRYNILSDTEMPGVLIEVGYMSNGEEAASLTDDAYQNDMAKGIAKGIILSLSE